MMLETCKRYTPFEGVCVSGFCDAGRYLLGVGGKIT